MELRHFVTTAMIDDDIASLFEGLEGPNEFNIKEYWKNASEVAEVIGERSGGRYSNWETIMGDIGEILIEAMIARFPTDFHLRPGTLTLPSAGQKGYDMQAKHVNDDKPVWIQVKFYCPWEAFGEKDPSEAIHKLDSFVQSTVQDEQLYHRRHRLLISTSKDIYYKVGECGYTSQMVFYDISDLNHILYDGQLQPSAFWYEFRDSLKSAIDTRIPLPKPVEPYPDQKEDAKSIIRQLNNSNCTYIAPVGTGKTVVALEVIRLENNEDNSD